jgi:hypothetical protein
MHLVHPPSGERGCGEWGTVPEGKSRGDEFGVFTQVNAYTTLVAPLYAAIALLSTDRQDFLIGEVGIIWSDCVPALEGLWAQLNRSPI